MSRPFARILEPPEPWYQQPPDPERLRHEFVGKYDAISVCAVNICPVILAVAAFYGPTTRPGPVRPSCLSFTDDEVVARTQGAAAGAGAGAAGQDVLSSAVALAGLAGLAALAAFAVAALFGEDDDEPTPRRRKKRKKSSS